MHTGARAHRYTRLEVELAVAPLAVLLAVALLAVAAILASHVVEHVPDLVGYLNQVADILIPGGVLRLAVPEAWRDAPLAKLLAAVDAWEMAKARKKAKRGRRPVRARSARCEDLEGYNLDHLSVYEAIEASGGCVVLR